MKSQRNAQRKQHMKRNEKFGINMKQWCTEHEAFIAAREPSRELLEIHLSKIKMLQHERLVHLIVTLLVSIVELFVISLVILHPELGLWPAVAMLGFAVLLIFYFSHYFFLENTVQRWYRIADDLRARLL